MGDPFALLIDALSWFCLVVGGGFCIVSGIGIVRMPDFYTRGHAAGLSDTLGAGLILLGLMLQGGVSLITGKLLFIFFFLYVTSPTSTHALFKAAYANGMRWDIERAKHHPDLIDSFDRDPEGDRGSD